MRNDASFSMTFYDEHVTGKHDMSFELCNELIHCVHSTRQIRIALGYQTNELHFENHVDG
jgi:hypothetical protein